MLELALSKTKFNIDRDTIHGSLMFKKIPEVIANCGLITSVQVELL